MKQRKLLDGIHHTKKSICWLGGWREARALKGPFVPVSRFTRSFSRVDG